MLKFFICIKDNVSTCQICDDLGQNSQSSSNDAKSRLKYLFQRSVEVVKRIGVELVGAVVGVIGENLGDRCAALFDDFVL